ncbi:MAG: glycosyltransferase family 2 protein, partial [Anaerolineales bacterium]
ACAESLSRSDYANLHLVVIDNGSSDDSPEQVRSRVSRVEMLKLDENMGYAGGNNVGVALAIQRGAKYVLIVNNDTLVAPDMLWRLVAFAETGASAGIVGPQIRCSPKSNQLFAQGSRIFWQQGRTRHSGMFEPITDFAHVRAPFEADFIPGCGVLIRRDVIQSTGMLDESYFLNFEDVEFAVRARIQGFGSWVVPSALMWHKISSTLGRGSPSNTYYATRNSLRFFMTNGPRSTRLVASTRIIARTLRTYTAWSLKSNYRTAGYSKRRVANLYALRDFFTGRSGKMGADVNRAIAEA